MHKIAENDFMAIFSYSNVQSYAISQMLDPDVMLCPKIRLYPFFTISIQMTAHQPFLIFTGESRCTCSLLFPVAMASIHERYFRIREQDRDVNNKGNNKHKQQQMTQPRGGRILHLISCRGDKGTFREGCPQRLRALLCVLNDCFNISFFLKYFHQNA